ncbi:MAG: hypothetical protein ACRDG3_04620 [Tepidiformaceae bacterium]
MNAWTAMRSQVYWLTALVAWPAAVWCTVELLLRAATGYGEGTLNTVTIGLCAVATLVATNWRRGALAGAATRRNRRD